MTTIEFLRRCTSGNFRIVNSGDLCRFQISEAQSKGLWYVDPETGYGWALLPWGRTTDRDRNREEAYFESKKTATQVELGEGKTLISVFHDPDGAGVVFRNTGEEHEIGKNAGEPAGPHIPEPGEIYVKCHNRASALTLLEQVACVVSCFQNE